MLAGGPRLPRNAWRACLLLPILPDIDVLAFRLGIPYENLFGHRGIVHSLAFAAVAAGVATLLVRPSLTERWRNRPWLLWCGLFALAASHGLLDALTNGGLGIALLAPFDRTRYFFPVTPIAVSPIGLWGFLSRQGVTVLLSEMLWVWLPLAVIVAGGRLWMAGKRGKDESVPAE